MGRPRSQISNDRIFDFNQELLMQEIAAPYIEKELRQPGDVTIRDLADYSKLPIHVAKKILDDAVKAGKVIQLRVRSERGGLTYVYRKVKDGNQDEVQKENLHKAGEQGEVYGISEEGG